MSIRYRCRDLHQNIAVKLADLINAIMKEGKISKELVGSQIKAGNALEIVNVCGLKLTNQMLKVVEKESLKKIINHCTNIDDMQINFMPRHGKADVISIVGQLQVRFIYKKKKNQILHLVFVHLQRTFDRVPRRVLWWTMQIMGVPDGLLPLFKQFITMQRAELE